MLQNCINCNVTVFPPVTQTVVLDKNRLVEFPSCLLGLPCLARLSLAHNLLCALPHAFHSLSRCVNHSVLILTRCCAGASHTPTLPNLARIGPEVADRDVCC